MEFGDGLRELARCLQSKGYVRKGKLLYKVSGDLAYCLEFEIPGQMVYALAYILPLYIPHENRSYTYGIRVTLNGVRAFRDAESTKLMVDNAHWWKEFLALANRRFFPWMDRITAPRKLVCAVSCKWRSPICCPEIQKLRLRFFTLAFCGKYKAALGLASRYRKVIRKTSWLISSVRENLERELDELSTLLQTEPEAVAPWFERTMENTAHACSVRIC